MEPVKGTFKIQKVGPMKSGTSKSSGKPWKTYDLQFEGDPTWYNTYWSKKEDPMEGDEIEGTKSFDDKFNSYKFEMAWAGGGKNKWNPAAAQATVMAGAATVVNGFLANDKHYQLWISEKPEDGQQLKTLFNKYLSTVEVVAKRLKDSVVSMGSIEPEQKTVTKTSPAPSGDPGPTPPPDDGWPGGDDEEELSL